MLQPSSAFCMSDSPDAISRCDSWGPFDRCVDIDRHRVRLLDESTVIKAVSLLSTHIDSDPAGLLWMSSFTSSDSFAGYKPYPYALH